MVRLSLLQTCVQIKKLAIPGPINPFIDQCHSHVNFQTTCNLCLYSMSIIYYFDFVNYYRNVYSHSTTLVVLDTQHNLIVNNPIHNTVNNNLNIYYQNMCGLRTKIFNFSSNIILFQYDVFVLTETWLSDEISIAEFFPSNFLIFRYERNKNTSSKTRGGGCLLMTKNHSDQ
jgi:hypothetical protein